MGAGTANADDLPDVNQLNQSEFSALADDLGAAFSIGGFSAGASVSLAGVQLGVGLGAANLSNRNIWRAAWRDGGSPPSNLIVSKWRATIPLSSHLDLSGQYAFAHGTSLRSVGADLRIKLVNETLVAPGLFLGVSATHLLGTESVRSNTLGLNLGISKRLPLITPYAGVGHVWARTSPRGSTGLQAVTSQQNRLYAGVHLSAIFSLALEVERVGDSTNFSARYGLHF
jgi:hypothetical protein